MIHAVYRAQCSGPCRLWFFGERGRTSVVSRALEFATSDYAVYAARIAGWRTRDGLVLPGQADHVYCPDCWATLEADTAQLPVLGLEDTLTDLTVVHLEEPE